MCGIAGVFAFDSNPSRVAPARLRAMARALAHRGPDGDGFFTDPAHQVALAHRRLSIIDLAGGAQPIANEDGTVQVVFNGEIFNYVELRDALRRRGHVFRTASDTEVIAHLYEDDGDDFVHALNGQFAIALWDARRRRLLLVRDRPGILPLFFRRTPHEVAFGSEIKAILAGLPIAERPGLHADALRDTFTTWAPVSPDSLFAGVQEVEPGQQIAIDAGGARARTYWRWTLAREGDVRRGDPCALAEELRALLLDAVRIRLRADVPVGAYLSGGLDSSVLTALVARLAPARLRTFSLAFEDPALDERAYQRAMIDAIGADHSTVCCPVSAIAAEFCRVVRAAETPILRTAPVPMHVLAAHVRARGFRVVLTGEGADEVLGGYDLFKEAKVRAFCLRDPASPSRVRLLRRLYPYLDFTRAQSLAVLATYFGDAGDPRALDDPGFSHRPRWRAGAWAETFLSPDLRARCSPETPADRVLRRLRCDLDGRAVFSRAQLLEARTLMAGYLLSSQGDRMLMAHSVEGRFPFLDHRVIEFANELDPHVKMRALDEKHLLKRAAADLVPAAILRRPKQPYRGPDAAAFFTPAAADLVSDLLSPLALRDSGCFAPDKVARLTAKLAGAAHARQPLTYRESAAWLGILATQAWHRQFQQWHSDAME